jgi:cytochrome c oxidase subunit 3
MRAALADQFHDLEQQRDTATFGMWVFLASELLLFGALFLSYTASRYLNAPAFTDASHHISTPIGALNTGILIVSSLTMALAVHGAGTENKLLLRGGLLLTMLFGVIFLSLKGYEYYQHYVEHKVPSIDFAYAGPYASGARLFFFFYFVMTGLHAVHMLVGLGLISVSLRLAWRGKFSAEYYTPVENVGLYWHFVDIVWVFLFPIFYLLGRG